MTARNLIFMVLAAILFSGPAIAQQSAVTPSLMLYKLEPSHPEKILLAFEKIAGRTPSFQTWAALSPYLDKASDGDVPAIINRETNRLSRAYTEFDVSQPLVVHTTIHLDDYSTLNGALHLNEFSTATFFAFSLYGEHIAIVPKDIATFGTLMIPKPRMDEMLGKAKGSAITAELLLKPIVADAKQPFVYNKKSYSLLLAEIAEIRFWTGTELLWNYRADWYQPKVDQSLMNLKQSDTQ